MEADIEELKQKIALVADKYGLKFDDLILSDLIQKGYGGNELLAKFKEAKKKQSGV